jgi:hypothetical protein
MQHRIHGALLNVILINVRFSTVQDEIVVTVLVDVPRPVSREEVPDETSTGTDATTSSGSAEKPSSLEDQIKKSAGMMD